MLLGENMCRIHFDFSYAVLLLRVRFVDVRMIINTTDSTGRGTGLSDGHIVTGIRRIRDRFIAYVISTCSAYALRIVRAENIERKLYKKKKKTGTRIAGKGIGRALPGGVRYYSNIIPRVRCMQILLRQQSGTGSSIIIIIIIYYTSYSYNPRTVTVGSPFRVVGGRRKIVRQNSIGPPRPSGVARGVGEKSAERIPRVTRMPISDAGQKCMQNKTFPVIVMPELCHARNAF